LSFSLYIAKRYLFTRSSNNAINIITLIAALGIIVGAIALFIVLSVFSGLKEFSLEFIRISDPDLKISAQKGKSFFFTDSIATILQDERVANYSQVVEENAFFEYRDKSDIASIKGVDANYLLVNNVDTAIYVGEWLDDGAMSTVVVGRGISATLSLGTYDFIESLKVAVPKPGKGYISNPKTAFNQLKLQPVGIFSLTEELDKKYVFSHLVLAQRLLGYKHNQISAIELKLSSNSNKKEVKKWLQTELGSHFKIETREQLNAAFYKMLNSENLAFYLIFTLILIIALFNVIGAIIMMILDKKDNLKTLFSLGATIKEIKKIFIFQGLLLTFFGLIIGLFIAIVFVLLQKNFEFIMITPSLAYPVEFRFLNVFIVFITILSLGYIAVKIASSRISKKIIE